MQETDPNTKSQQILYTYAAVCKWSLGPLTYFFFDAQPDSSKCYKNLATWGLGSLVFFWCKYIFFLMIRRIFFLMQNIFSWYVTPNEHRPKWFQLFWSDSNCWFYFLRNIFYITKILFQKTFQLMIFQRLAGRIELKYAAQLLQAIKPVWNQPGCRCEGYT